MSELLTDRLKTRFASNEWPVFLHSNTEGKFCHLAINIHAGLRWFEGHFPGQPVLAGVVQTHWAGMLCRYIFSINDDFQRIDNLKFQSVILPGNDIELVLEYNGLANAVKFKYFDDQATFSEGKLVFAER